MAIEILLDKNRGLVLGTAVGPLTADELVDGFVSILEDPEFDRDMPILVDMTATTHSLTAKDVRRMADKILVADPAKIRGLREAIVVSKTAVYGMIRMFQSYTETSGLDLGVFYTVDEAKEWLGVS